MRRHRLIALPLFVAALLLSADTAHAQRDNSRPRSSPNATVSQTIGTTTVNLHYSRPGMKGRTVFGELVPWGQVWRAGANEPTTLTLSGPVSIQGQTLEAGEYNLFVRPNQNGAWDVIFTTPVRWGTMFNDATPVLEVTTTPVQADAREWLTYDFENLTENSADLVLHWSDRRIPLTMSVGN